MHFPSGPPPHGSARESVLIDYFQRKDEISYARDLAKAQLMLDPKEGVKRFTEFHKILFPWVETAVAREKQKTKDELVKFIQSGPLAVSIPPQRPVQGVSRMVKSDKKRP